jgi:hypothetical protein
MGEHSVAASEDGGEVLTIHQSATEVHLVRVAVLG